MTRPGNDGAGGEGLVGGILPEKKAVFLTMRARLSTIDKSMTYLSKAPLSHGQAVPW